MARRHPGSMRTVSQIGKVPEAAQSKGLDIVLSRKSTLASLVVDTLQAGDAVPQTLHIQSDKDQWGPRRVGLASVYLDYKYQEKHTARKLLASLVTQLIPALDPNLDMSITRPTLTANIRRITGNL